jgi:hypothetical protein
VLHSPLHQNKNVLAAAMLKLERVGAVIPGQGFGSRPTKLTAATVRKNKDLLTEIRSYREATEALAQFVRDLHYAWQNQKPWPKRPKGRHL